MCSFCPRHTATSFSGIGRARTLLSPAQEQEKRVEEHRIPCPSDHTSGRPPLPQTARGPRLPRGDSRSPRRLCQPDPPPGALPASAGGPGCGGGSGHPGQPPQPGPRARHARARPQQQDSELVKAISAAASIWPQTWLGAPALRASRPSRKSERAMPTYSRRRLSRHSGSPSPCAWTRSKRNRGILASRARVRPRAAARYKALIASHIQDTAGPRYA